MTTTPEDIMAAARKIADEINASIDPIEAVEAAIAEAILAERERCAKVADEIRDAVFACHQHERAYTAAGVAAAIRKGPDQ